MSPRPLTPKPLYDPPQLRIGVDTGGTFTDLVLTDPTGTLLTHKLLSTPHNPAEAVLSGIQALLQKYPNAARNPHIIHGSTVATNALLEGRGAHAAFITTAGFEDTLALARQNRPDLYALTPHRPDPPIPRNRTLGVPERMLFDGTVDQALAAASITETIDFLKDWGVEAVVVSLLHSYANPVHEQALAEAIRTHLPEVHVTISHELLPEFREYERAATCVVNAVVAPVMTRYLAQLEDDIGAEQLRIMVSSGGTLPPQMVAREPVHTILSGPAGGAVGALTMAQASGIHRVITLDMGGTSTDVTLCDGDLTHTTETEIAGLPIRLPMIDLHTVGAGGGSVAWLDAGGVLRVGPASMGADPGPACYGKQTAPYRATVTDAHVVLGHLRPDQPLGGNLTLDWAAAEAAMGALAEQIGTDLAETAQGILQIAEATMARAVQRISVQKGHDPRDFVLMPFGGAGGLHACRLAEGLGMTRVLIPQHPGLLSALGMLCAAPRYAFSQGVMVRLSAHASAWGEHPTLQATCAQLIAKATAALTDEGLPPEQHQVTVWFDVRYAGQSFEITVPATPDPLQDFTQEHLRLYGYQAPEKAIEIVAVRVEANGPAHPLTLPSFPPQKTPPSMEKKGWHYQARAALGAGTPIEGPMILHEYSATTVIPTGWRGQVDDWGQILLEKTV